MRIKYFGNNIIIYLKKENIKQLDFNNVDSLEHYFKSLFTKLTQMIEIEFNGFYLLDIYLDNNYGAIIEIKPEDIDYYDYFNQVEMKITLYETTFLYQINDYFLLNQNIQKKLSFYYYKDKFYAKIEEKLTKKEMSELLEMSEIIYQTEQILKYSKKLKPVL